jgi:hypothetical protein
MVATQDGLDLPAKRKRKSFRSPKMAAASCRLLIPMPTRCAVLAATKYGYQWRGEREIEGAEESKARGWEGGRRTQGLAPSLWLQCRVQGRVFPPTAWNRRRKSARRHRAGGPAVGVATTPRRCTRSRPPGHRLSFARAYISGICLHELCVPCSHACLILFYR